LVIGRVWRMAFDLHATDTELKAVNPLPRVAARVVLRVSRGCGRGELIGKVILHIPVALPHTPGTTSPCLRSVRCRHGLTQDTADLVCYHGLRATYRSSLALQHRYSCRQHTHHNVINHHPNANAHAPECPEGLRAAPFGQLLQGYPKQSGSADTNTAGGAPEPARVGHCPSPSAPLQANQQGARPV
jgi:hypothetical protein